MGHYSGGPRAAMVAALIFWVFSNFVAFAMMNFFKLLKKCAEAVAYAMI